MSTFDPDEEFPFVEPVDESFIALTRSAVEIDSVAAQELLGNITRDLPGGGEDRQGQYEMVGRVAEAMSTRRHLVVEAGTGVGKSLAYLVPSALAGTRVVIATATKNLQDQLAGKDAPLVAAHQPGVSVAVLKGRANYLCKHKAFSVSGGAQISFDDDVDVPATVTAQLRKILDWSTTSITGDRDELGFEPDARAWRQLSVSPQECLSRSKCPQGNVCFAERAKEIAAASDIVIVNAHLYGAHLASGQMILPAHDIVIFDEAHEILDTFATVLGTSLNATRFRGVATMSRSLLGEDESEIIDEVHDAANDLASALTAQFEAEETTGLGLEVTAALAAAAQKVTALMEKVRTHLTDNADDENRRLQTQGPLTHLANDLIRLNKVGKDELIWLTRNDKEITIELSLVDVGPRLRDELWSNTTGILTSATIPANLVTDLGLSDISDSIEVASPFDYANHALLYVPDNFPERTDPNAEAAIIEELVRLITASGGRCLSLFTNRSVMKRVADAVEPRISTPVLVQDTLSRARLIERFRDEETSSLFAVTSYWQGIDVPGDSLRLVTIDRLPFQPPNDPLGIARRDRAGSSAFSKVDIPRAGMLLAQGVGRLIRSTTDKGVVAVLDTRLATANYRHPLIRRLPPMARTRDFDEVEAFLQSL